MSHNLIDWLITDETIKTKLKSRENNFFQSVNKMEYIDLAPISIENYIILDRNSGPLSM